MSSISVFKIQKNIRILKTFRMVKKKMLKDKDIPVFLYWSSLAISHIFENNLCETLLHLNFRSLCAKHEICFAMGSNSCTFRLGNA